MTHNKPCQLGWNLWLIGVVLLTSAWQCYGQDPLPAGTLTLINGNAVRGEFRPSESSDTIRWQGSLFTQPFEFVTNSISSVHFPTQIPTPQPAGQIAIELASGDMLTGTLKSWTAENVELDSPHFGTLHIHPDALRRIYRLEGNPLLVYAGLTGLGDWRTHDTPWKEDGPAIESDADEAMLSGDFQIPDKAVIEFEFSWPSKPNFAFVLAADPNAPKDSRQDGWRFEMWDQLLGVLREHKDVADVDRVAMILPTVSRIHLIAYLDQIEGTIQVFQADGTPAGKITVKPTPGAKPGRGLRLINRHGTIKLERLRIAHWNGQVPTSIPAGQVGLQFGEGESLIGSPQGFDPAQREYLFQENGQERRVPEAQFIMAEWGPPAQIPVRSVASMLQDGTRLSGSIERVEAQQLVLKSPDIDEALPLPHPKIRSLVMSERTELTEVNAGRRGRLEIDSLKLEGHLVPGTETAEANCIAWQPVGSRTGSPLRPGAHGHIIYRDAPKVDPTRQQPVQQRPAVNFLDIFLKNSDKPPTRKPQEINEHNIHLRSGDIIPCTVKSIDELGVAIKSTVTEAQVIPHSTIKAIELIRGKPPELKDAKQDRLLTIPRLQKSSPPTHLLCSPNGDFLRCRLVSMSAEQLVVEVQLEEMRIPRDRIGQIVWFHPEELPQEQVGMEEMAEGTAEQPPEKSQTADSHFSHLAQIIQHGGNRVTFDPTTVDDTTISGTSEVLGACKFAIEELDAIHFGSAIEEVVAELVYSQWKLHSAVEPLVAQDLDGDSPDQGSASPLVGQPAPDIDLELLEGGRFQLSKLKGQIVVLDFWATWCGPCMHTMPLVEAAMLQYDPAQVQLIAVNLEEPASEIREALTLHDLHPTVALDTDGVAARRYQANAIPQLVIIDAEGKVAKLYVGGGQGVVDQLQESLNAMLMISKPDQPGE